jgi:Flp pilus assembly protein TadD
LTAFEEALTLDPTHAAALQWRVTALRQLRRFTDAETTAREAIERRPDVPTLHVELGRLFKTS